MTMEARAHSPIGYTQQAVKRRVAVIMSSNGDCVQQGLTKEMGRVHKCHY